MTAKKEFVNVAKLYNKDLERISDFQRLKSSLSSNPNFDVSKMETKLSKLKLKSDMMKIMICGLTGTGKSTIAKAIAEATGIEYISSSNYLEILLARM